MNVLDTFLFGLYPYICLTVFLLGSLIRFDRDQYTWKSDSSQLLRVGQLRVGSNLFHIGVLFLFFGHLVGMLTPHFVYENFISAGSKPVSLGSDGSTPTGTAPAVFLSGNATAFGTNKGTGGGLTVIANAPNPAGQSILQQFFPGGVSPLGLLAGALAPTAVMAACFLWL